MSPTSGAAAGVPLPPSVRRRLEALWANHDKHVRSTTLERLRLMRLADDEVRGRPQPRQLAIGLAYLLNRISTPVAPGDLLLGRIAEEVPDEAGEALFQRTVEQWHGRGVPPWMRDAGHECFAWDRLLELGFAGLQSFAANELARRRAAGEPAARLEWLAGTVGVYEAFRAFAVRYAEAAYAADLGVPADRLAALVDRPPRSFAEALQLVWLVELVYCTMAAPNPTLTLGRLDQLLLPYYQADLAAGRLTRDEAAELIDDFYSLNNLIVGRGEHQLSGSSELATGWARNLTYDSPQYLILGGIVPGDPIENGSENASDNGAAEHESADDGARNELTDLFLERIVPGYEDPVIVYRYVPDGFRGSAGTSDATLQLLAEKLRANAAVLVYNDAVAVPAFESSGFSCAEAADYCLYGCNWPTLAGRERSLLVCRPILPQHVLDAILGAPGEATPALEDLDVVYARFADSFRAQVEEFVVAFRLKQARFAEDEPGPLRIDDCFLDGPVARARSWQHGGMLHSTLTFGLAGLATAANSLAAIDELVFRTRAVSLADIRAALRVNFVGHERIRQLCRHAPKFGRDEDRADQHAVRLIGRALDIIDQVCQPTSPTGIRAYRTLTTDAIHAQLGADVGATPDGRGAGEPLSENQSPSLGTATAGLTALLHSLAKLPFARVNSGPNNLRIQPRLVAGPDGLERLTAVLKAYFGPTVARSASTDPRDSSPRGEQLQFSFVDANDLRRAQADPTHYRDLMVRITGYSAVFVDMAREAQDEIIRRTELS